MYIYIYISYIYKTRWVKPHSGKYTCNDDLVIHDFPFIEIHGLFCFGRLYGLWTYRTHQPSFVCLEGMIGKFNPFTNISYTQIVLATTKDWMTQWHFLQNRLIDIHVLVFLSTPKGDLFECQTLWARGLCKEPPAIQDPHEIRVDEESKLTLHGLLQYYVKLTEKAWRWESKDRGWRWVMWRLRWEKLWTVVGLHQSCLFEQTFGKHQVIRIVPVTLSSLAMFPVFTQQFTGLHLQCVEVVIWDLFLELYNQHFFSI